MLSVAVMLVSVSVLQGFQKEIKDKIAGFSSHIQLCPYSTRNVKQDDTFVSLSSQEKQSIAGNPDVAFFYPVICRAGVLINEDSFHPVMVKGIDNSFNKSFFESNIVSGRFPQLDKQSKQEILISKTIADKFNLKIKDKIKVYFYVGNTYRAKNFHISGLYDTGLGEYDESFFICDMSVLRNIFSIDEGLYSYYEITLKDIDRTEKACNDLYYKTDSDKTLIPVTELEQNLFSWLNLLDSNVIMILVIMILVSVVTLSSVILIMIFEKKTHIGILKSIGASNGTIIKIFLYKASYVTLKGMIFGNILALGLELIQKYFHIITLDKESYYLSTAPIDINPWYILFINIGVFAVCLASLLIPARSINKIDPVKNIKFE